MTKKGQQFAEDGFLLVQDVVPRELIARVARRMEQQAGEGAFASLPPNTPRKMDNMHVADNLTRELAGHPAIGRLAAEIAGASLVQVFATQSLIKTPAGKGHTEVGNIGWHQDFQYWHQHLDGELFTAWVALTDVTAESGPMRFVAGSHRRGLLKAGNFFGGNLDALKASFQTEHNGPWEEVPAILRPGSVSFHHRLTIHGSGPNRSAGPRMSLAIHLRTEKSSLAPGIKFGDAGWLNDFTNETACPVLYRREASKAGSTR